MEPDSLDWLSESGAKFVDPEPEESAVFDREWALTLVAEAAAEVAHDFERKYSAIEFAVLKKFLPGSSSAPSYESAAAELKMTEVAVRTAVSRTVNAPHEVDEELRYLASLLMKPDSSLSHGQASGKESQA